MLELFTINVDEWDVVPESAGGHLYRWFDIERFWARDLSHLTSRFARQFVARTVILFLNLTHERSEFVTPKRYDFSSLARS
ncbi:hypothetical protein IQ235_02485 [Oscillatoriales cyanobacterium LEGE 11467]|uniref:Uncharacterized protein n=1 Tax=Zarconia navalis LEGE 11467 TaxID=1828826 RepID=A0A928VVT8_9CYAN|nr:hypothetical protein [Zarconia navalis]MBE9039662.1 hypothetical protein [Zarconia navalis LEGE 11467]